MILKAFVSSRGLDFPIGKAMCLWHRLFILAILLFGGMAGAQLIDVPPTKRMSGTSCIDSDGKQSPAREVGSGPNVDTAYLQQISFCEAREKGGNGEQGKCLQSTTCAVQQTCLTEKRLEYLEGVRMLPMGLKNPQTYLGVSKQLSQQMSCYEDEGNIERQVLEIDHLLKKSKKTLPSETKLATELTLKIAEEGRETIKNHRAAITVLRDCYQLDADFDQRPELRSTEAHANSSNAAAELEKRNQKKIELYRKSELRKQSARPFCERIWNGKESIAGTMRNLTELRQSLLGLQLQAYKRAHWAKDFETLFQGMRAGKLPADKEFGALAPSNRVLLASNPLYANAPKRLAPATSDELRGMNEFYRKLDGRYPGVDMGEALLSNVNRLLAQDPMLIYFESARPSSAELAKVFKLYADNLKSDSFEDSLSDFKFYTYPKLVEKILNEYSPEMRGDVCAIAEYVHRRSDEIKHLPATMLMDMTTIAGGGAALAAKGIVGRTLAFMSAGMIPGMALLADSVVDRALSVQYERDMCQSMQLDTGEKMCRPAKINRDLIELQIQGMGLMAAPLVSKGMGRIEARRARAEAAAAAATEAEAIAQRQVKTYQRYRSGKK